MLALSPRPGAASVQEPVLPVSPVEIILDASASMHARMGDSETMTVAREFVRALRSELAAGGAAPPLGLRVYGGSADAPEVCRDTRLAVRPADSEASLVGALAAAQPLGPAPLAFALESALADSARAYVLVTSGSEGCGGDACAVWRNAVAGRTNRGARIHVVALGVPDDAAEALRCLSRAGSGAYVSVRDRSGVGPAARRLALILRNEGLLDVRLSVEGGETFTAPVRVLIPLSRKPVAAFNARGPRAVPAGIYDVVVETSPSLPAQRVMILPGETTTIARADFGRLEVEVRDEADRPVRVPLTIRAPGRRADVRYAATGETLILVAGTYDLSVDLGDSIAARRNVAVTAGRTARVVLGGRGAVAVISPEFSAPPRTRAILTRGARMDTLWIGETKSVTTGRHRLRVETLPTFVSDDISVATGDTTVVELPPLGILSVEVRGAEGLIPGQLGELQEPLTRERYGSIVSGERRLVMPGRYRVELATVPVPTRADVTIRVGEETVVERRGFSRIEVVPAEAAPGGYRLEILNERGGRLLAERAGPAPVVAARPGTYWARVSRGAALLWEGRVAVASGKPARIDLPRP